MVAILDRIKRAEAARAAAAAADASAAIAAMTEDELIADLGRLDALRGISAEGIARHQAFWHALRGGDIDAQRALDKHRVAFGRADLSKMTVSEMRAELEDFDAMQSTTVGRSDLSNFA